MSKKYTEAIQHAKASLFALFNKGKRKADVAKQIQQLTGMTYRNAFRKAAELEAEYSSPHTSIQQEFDFDQPTHTETPTERQHYRERLLQSLQNNIHKDVYYNDQDQVYVVNLNSKGNTIFTENELKQMLEAYSNFDDNPATINEICRRFEISRADFVDLKSKLGWSHDSLPITASDLLEKSEDHIVSDLQQKAQHGIEQKYRKSMWRETQQKALKWDLFVRNTLNPFTEYLQNLDMAEFAPVSRVQKQLQFPGKSLVIGCNDWQLGAAAQGALLNKGRDYNLEIAMACVDSFINQIEQDLLVDDTFEDVHIFLAGDLGHGLKGQTSKGTMLAGKEMCAYEYEQFDAIVKCISRLIGSLGSIFPNVYVHAVRGNHLGFDWYPIIKLVEQLFSQSPHIEFNIALTRSICFRVQDVLIIGDHGASADFKGGTIPMNGKPRESWVQTLLLNLVETNPRMFDGVKQKIFIQGDKHQFQQLEMSNFEFFMFGALPLGDYYAAEQNLFSRSRQNALVINENGVKEVRHYYFD